MHRLIPYLPVGTLNVMLDGEELLGMREIRISLQLITDPDLPVLYSSVFFVDLLVIGAFFLSSRSRMSSSKVF